MGGGAGRVRVLLYLRAAESEVAAVEEAYHRISKDLAGTPGLLGNELLRETSDPGAFAVLSEWENLAAFRTWESGSAHRGTTSPLRAYQDGERPRPFALYEVAAEY
ncbi:antibiotic biosynthesis monooxygenase family protein [Streptomyces reniochalinae]|uniref:Antibiotic biosynthesis monooxygenase n=1 Tax=Streptomyces reniochalinae TaxID=2250578 RepID=A0A367F5W6_9ACTN|nr:antibiotic biosynthesis monooxygenase family protein [Streptomyces reniochalinae]RCG25252.1 antibiotic biosynthesis monooxygenase [Streptomyces reniochalinae]